MDGTVAHHSDEPLDDWLGDISDDDWSEQPQARASSSASPDDEIGLSGSARPSAVPRRVAATPSRRASVHRRRVVAVVALGVVLLLAGVTSVVLLRDDAEPSAAPAPDASSTTPTQTETTPSSTPTPPSTTPAPSPTPSPPPASAAAAFTLPEGTKLQSSDRDPSTTSDLVVTTDPEVVTELQEALTAAGYDPGPADGTFGPRTEAAVIEFQQANGLSTDGVVGPETAAKLNEVIAAG